MGIDQKVQSKMIVEENILGISHGQSRTHTACHAHVKFNDEDYFQTFNAGLKHGILNPIKLSLRIDDEKLYRILEYYR